MPRRDNKPIRRTADWSVDAKWGGAIGGGDTGFQAIPDVLLKCQEQLGLSCTDMVVMLNILLHWWQVEELPHPRISVIARRMGVTVRTVERSVARLEVLGLVIRGRAEKKGDGPSVRRFDPSGLVYALEEKAEKIRAANGQRATAA
jgi:hypothetical protein